MFWRVSPRLKAHTRLKLCCSPYNRRAGEMTPVYGRDHDRDAFYLSTGAASYRGTYILYAF